MKIMVNPKDLHYNYDTRGYMLYYKEKPIGGAGIDRYAKGCRSNLKLFRECAERDKWEICFGIGEMRYMQEIQKIDREE